ncbi:MAG TPA: hypothetical protein VNA57_02830 [Acidimicrobiales bacterium]|nr:hypothetical protein [Acidimicrobiales bacterium]
MPRLRLAAAACVLLAGLGGAAPAGAAGDLELQFLDTRPIVVDLDALEDEEARWRVGVFNGQPGGPQRLSMHVVFDPVDVIVVEDEPDDPVPTGTTASFVIALDEELAGSGELVVTSDSGAAARRPISVRRSGEDGIPVGALRFSGTRSHPFGGGIRVPALEVPGAPGGSSDSVSIGSVVSGSGDVAHLVRRDDVFEVDGVAGTGEYTGTADLTPGADGGEAEVSLTVRDAAGWPLALLLLGLGAVQGLERYQKRVRPRRELALRLAHLKDRARLAQKGASGPLLICGEADEAELVLDVEAARALEAWDRARTEAERSVWDFGGASFARLSAAVEDFARLTHEHADLESRRQRVIARCLEGDREAAERALDGSPVGEALRPRRFTHIAHIAAAAEELEAAAAHLDRFAVLYEQLGQLARFGDDGVQMGAAVLRSKLLTPGVDLDPLEEEVEELLKAWRPAPTRVEQPAAAARGMSLPSPPPVSAPSAAPAPTPIEAARARREARQRRRALPLAAGSFAALLAILLAVSLIGEEAQGPDRGPRGGDGPPSTVFSPAPGGGDGTAGPPGQPDELPDAPVSAPATPPRPAAPTGDDGTGTNVVVPGFLVPLALVVAVLGGVLLVLRALRRRRRAEDLDSARLDRLLASEDRRFALASGLFVVATGMSLLYVPNPTFGGPGDYLTVVLWGAGVGEGIQLVRRILPGVPGR